MTQKEILQMIVNAGGSVQFADVQRMTGLERSAIGTHLYNLVQAGAIVRDGYGCYSTTPHAAVMLGGKKQRKDKPHPCIYRGAHGKLIAIDTHQEYLKACKRHGERTRMTAA